MLLKGEFDTEAIKKQCYYVVKSKMLFILNTEWFYIFVAVSVAYNFQIGKTKYNCLWNMKM
jgi:hypothetical protein